MTSPRRPRLAASGVAMIVACCAIAAGPRATADPTSGQVVRVDHYDPSTTPARGPTNALVTIELFFAPSINGAVRLPAYELLEELQRRHPTRIRLVYRVVRRGAQPPGPQLPTLALEAYAHGKFFEFVDRIHAERNSMTREEMLELAAEVGLDPLRAERAITEDRYGELLTQNERRLERLRGTTSPMVFFNAKPARGSLTSMRERDYDNAYLEAFDRASELLDRGLSRDELMPAFEAELRTPTQPVVVATRADGVTHALASPPLDLTGMPAFGAADAAAPVPVVVLCRPNDVGCNQTLKMLRNLHNTYRGEIRLVWAPWFDVAREDATELTLLGDAALCAEQIGSNPNDLEASAGWSWVTETLSQVSRRHGRRVTADRLIDMVAARLQVDLGALSACRARISSATLKWIAAARRAGVTAAPAIVIGGRIYHGLSDHALIRRLIEAELAPGVLGRCATSGC